VSDLRLVLVQTRYQLVSIARNRRAMVLGVVFPVLLLVMFNSVFVKGTDTTSVNGARVAAHAYFAGGMLAYAIMSAAFTQVALGLVGQRESGQLKPLRGTPVPAWTFIVAIVLRAVVTVGLTAVVLLAIAGLGYGVPISRSALGEIALYVVLGTATMCSLGVGVTALLSDLDSASAALPLASVVLALISGIFVPIDQLPDWLEHVARVFPVYHLAAGLQSALGVGGPTGLDAGNATALVVWAVAGIVLATRRFRWVPQAAGA
jgi:ABC-2 type transport system permease protein